MGFRFRLRYRWVLLSYAMNSDKVSTTIWTIYSVTNNISHRNPWCLVLSPWHPCCYCRLGKIDNAIGGGEFIFVLPEKRHSDYINVTSFGVLGKHKALFLVANLKEACSKWIIELGHLTKPYLKHVNSLANQNHIAFNSRVFVHCYIEFMKVYGVGPGV